VNDASLRIVVTGLLAQYPLGGVAWDYLQYPVGLQRLGHDVYYIENTGQWPFNPDEQGVSKGCDYNVQHLSTLMQRFGLGDRWAYCFPWEEQWFGMSDDRRANILATADIFINVSGVWRDPVRLREETDARLVFIDSDPVFTQVKLARGQVDFQRSVDAHDIHFSFGEAHSARIPATGHDWLPTRQPVLLDEWAIDSAVGERFTTVMNWTSYNPVEFEGVSYGQKDIEFRRFLDLPSAVDPIQLEVAMSPGKNQQAPLQLLRHRGWRIVDPSEVCPDLDSYRRYITTSRGEWSVAKHGYVIGSPGWFSCRSACYLAAGRPVVVEDTGLESVVPTGVGVLTFSTLEEAADALRAVNGDIERHARAAREIAAEYFDSAHVLNDLLARVPNGSLA
jgi:Glycosyl transferases group 1